MGSLVERLNQLRGSKNVSEFARISGINQQAMARYCAGERTPNAEAIQKICTSNGVKTDWLLGIETFADHFRQALETLGMTVQEFARKAKSESRLQQNETYYAGLVNGTFDPTPGVVIELARLLGLKTAQLNGDEPMPQKHAHSVTPPPSTEKCANCAVHLKTVSSLTLTISALTQTNATLIQINADLQRQLSDLRSEGAVPAPSGQGYRPAPLKHPEPVPATPSAGVVKKSLASTPRG